MSIATETVVFFAIAFVIFGLVFVLLGMSSERGYWSQRDPSGDARKAATGFHTVYHRAFKIAAGDLKKNNVVVPVFEIKDPKPYSKEREAKNDPLKVGSIYDVNYNGNWK